LKPPAFQKLSGEKDFTALERLLDSSPRREINGLDLRLSKVAGKQDHHPARSQARKIEFPVSFPSNNRT